MAAFVALPAFFLIYVLTAPIGYRRRLVHLCVAAAVVAGTSLLWPAAVDLTPVDRRPYIAETNDSSMLNLAFGFQGFGRVLNRAAPAMRSGGLPSSQVITGHGGAPGPFRLASRDMAGHITLFLPVVLVGAIAMISRKRLEKSRRGPYRDALFWIVWVLTFASVFSLPRTFIHSYYLAMLAPAVAVLAAVAAGSLWTMLEYSRRSAVLPAAAVVFTLLWHLRILGFHPPWARLLVPVLSVTGLSNIVGMLLARTPFARRFALVLGGAAAFVSPLLWAATPALAPVGRMVPIADPVLLDYRDTAAAEGPRQTHLPALVRFLRRNHSGERFFLAVRDIHLASPVICETGEAVMAFGGYYGHETTLSVEEFARMVSAGEVRYALLAADRAGTMAGPPRRSSELNEIEKWVKSNGTLVPPEAWQSPGVEMVNASAPMPMWGPIDRIVSMMYGWSGLGLYDCRASRE